ncbi:MAG: tetratricopeptide repeat protein [Bacteroidota bacterium]
MPDIHAHAGVMEVLIPNAKRDIIFKSGHLIPLEQSEAFNSSVIKFLNGLEFYIILNSQGVNAAVKHFITKLKSEPGVKILEENEINALEYSFLQNGKTKDAIELFKLNTVVYPNSANVYDSLGEACLKDGQIDLAIKNYKKSLELNPQNEYVKKILEQLQKK